MLRWQDKISTKIITLILIQSFLFTGVIYPESINNKDIAGIYKIYSKLRVPMAFGEDQKKDAKNRSDKVNENRIIGNINKKVDDALEALQWLIDNVPIGGWSETYRSMVDILAESDKLNKNILQAAQRLAGAYDFYLQENIKPIIDALNDNLDEWQALNEIKPLKTGFETKILFSKQGYRSMMDVLVVSGKLSSEEWHNGQKVGSAADYAIKRRKMLTALFSIALDKLEPEDRRILKADLETWDGSSRPNLDGFKGTSALIQILLKPEYEQRFPYSRDVNKPISEKRFLSVDLKRRYLPVALAFYGREYLLKKIEKLEEAEERIVGLAYEKHPNADALVSGAPSSNEIKGHFDSTAESRIDKLPSRVVLTGV